MIGVKLSDAKKLFFDARKIQDRADRLQLRALSKFGAFVMRDARQSIKIRDDVSPPGQPPHAHAVSTRIKVSKKGKTTKSKVSRFRETIFFFVEIERKNMVAGPILLDGGDPEAPGLLEHGGDGTVERQRPFGIARLPAKYRARPFMLPAFDKEKTNPKLTELFKDKL